MVEVPRSASLHWNLSPQERGRIHDLINNTQPRSCPNEDRPRVQHARDPLHAFDSARGHQQRHSKHWVNIVAVGQTVLTHTHFFLESARDAVFRVLIRGHISVRSWRVQTSLFGWDEALFLAVFGGLGEPTDVTLLSPIKNAAVSFDSAAATKYVYRRQILSRTGPLLENWCSFENMNNSNAYWSFGCAIKHHSVRFILELAAILIINNNRIQGKRSEVRLLVSTAVLNNEGILHEPLPRSSNTTNVPVVMNDSILERARVYIG